MLLKAVNQDLFSAFYSTPSLGEKKKKTNRTGTASWTDPLLIKSTKLKCQMKIDEARKKTL